MLLLTSTTDLLRLTTSSAATLDVHTSWVDNASGVISPGRTNTKISSATTTTVVGSPVAATQRAVESLAIRNTHASLSADVTVVHTDGTTAVNIYKITIGAGEGLTYDKSAFTWTSTTTSTVSAQIAAAIPTFYSPASIGQWYMNPLTTAIRTLAPTLNRLYLYPIFSGPTGCSIDRFDVTTTIAGTATAVARFGLWKIDNQAAPFTWVPGSQYATLTFDAGVVATDSVAGTKTVTPSPTQAIAANTWFAVGVVHQVAASATCNVTGASGSARFSPLGNGSAIGGGSTSPGLSLYQDSVTGAFGAFTPNGVINVDGGAGFRRSA
ncbi:hypothetical protein UFOVP1183_37 [uncultured Caudovirales phage]|uniref:Uncharacterized protein n=1 Tax=uncultured Caudovirales phage TaxID=2100421 RepID=A0A6J5PTW4_9CAUD|nr:hypothetical protein UFOVP955_45 [uncultured Caudovirales phage]CAB4185365.1 hypothetical protein UFOVP1120_43 [uncultured Caudovirales phage]CAB4188459.1 hypothetical protein UFOVP1183_37 [uncultured Caudovirales phage]CAB4191233.1 hypothetical protein UFOVP1227_20 [uncultured Caudovirales phage]CAB5230118.1 hypothetical protein UFOVP1571_43 [uncultured Caudovirales phage]